MIQIEQTASTFIKKDRLERSLKEYVPEKLAIEPEDAEILYSDFSDKLEFHEVWKKPGCYSINPNNYVGVISLPNLILRLNPKVEISNLFYMLSYAYEMDFFRDEPAPYENFEDIYEFIIEIFNKKVTELIQSGILRNYIETQENINYVKGKISIRQNIKENNILQHRIFCIFDDYTPNILENQIIKYVLFILSKDSYKARHLSDMIRENYYHLEEVSNKIILPQNFPAIHYTRLNLHYEHTHKLCKLILDNLSISERTGSNAFSSFLLDMNELFEKFICRLLLEKTKNIKEISICSQSMDTLDNDGEIKIKPDILILKNEVPAIVLDTKYKKRKDNESINFDIYQVLAYCKGFNIKKAILLYPEWEWNSRKRDIIRVKNSDIEIKIMTINLAGDRKTFDKNCANFVKDVLDFAGFSIEPYFNSVFAPAPSQPPLSPPPPHPS